MNGTSFKKAAMSNRNTKPGTYRRIVTGNLNGKAVVQSDEPLPAYEFRTVPGYEHTLIWVNPATPDLSEEQRFDRYPDSVVPGPGGTSLHFVTFPPDSLFADPSFDGEAAQKEALVRLPGLAHHFEKEDMGMHKTNTVDYSVVCDGEIWLELDDGETVRLKRRRGRAKRYAPRVAKQKHQAGHDALFPERRKRKTMTKKLEGKTAVITGGTEGIGLATAKLFVKEGAYVFITGRRQMELDEAVKAIGANVSGVQGDVAQLGDLDRLYETISKVNGRIDIVFANAGVGEFVPFGAVTEEHFEKLFNINVRGTLFTVQKALPLLNDAGSIILNGSVASVKGTAAFGVYAASKAAIRSFVRTWTTDLKARRIRSNVVSPGPINTPLASRQSADVIARIVSTIPMGRMGQPDEVAKVALFLASDDSSFVTGVELFVDGGRVQI